MAINAMGALSMTKAQKEAIKWLKDRVGDAAFDRNGVALAQGETSPVRRLTWNALASIGLVEFYNNSGKGRGRIRIAEGADRFAP